jgi:hypothetical protein
MPGRLFWLLVCGALAITPRLEAQTLEDLRLQCARVSFERYSIANIAILTSQSLMTPEAQLQQWRLQKMYCARLARCAAIGIEPASAAIAYSAAYSSCLKEESQSYDND